MNYLDRDIQPGEVVVVAPMYMAEGFKDISNRLFICKGGFGMKTSTIGGKIFGDYIIPGPLGYTDDVIRGSMIERLATPEEIKDAERQAAKGKS